jgi:hypothetical protein
MMTETALMASMAMSLFAGATAYAGARDVARCHHGALAAVQKDLDLAAAAGREHGGESAQKGGRARHGGA